jgi:hypothetical protein
MTNYRNCSTRSTQHSVLNSTVYQFSIEDIQFAIRTIQGNIALLTGILNNTDHISVTFADVASDALFSSAQDLIVAARSLLATVRRSMQPVQDAAYSYHDPAPSQPSPYFDSLAAYTPEIHGAVSPPDPQPSHLVDRVCSREPHHGQFFYRCK